MLFEMGLRKDFLTLEKLMQRSLFLKRNVTKRWVEKHLDNQIDGLD